MLDLRVTYEVKPLFHNREPGRTSYRVIRRVTIGNSDVATMEIARYAHEHDAQIVASRLRLSAHDEEHDHYPSAEEEVEVTTFADAARRLLPEPGPTLSELAERVERLEERVQGLAETNNLWDGS
jgi:hypothetical protein